MDKKAARIFKSENKRKNVMKSLEIQDSRSL